MLKALQGENSVVSKARFKQFTSAPRHLFRILSKGLELKRK